jgi:hypothetical protein
MNTIVPRVWMERRSSHRSSRQTVGDERSIVVGRSRLPAGSRRGHRRASRLPWRWTTRHEAMAPVTHRAPYRLCGLGAPRLGASLCLPYTHRLGPQVSLPAPRTAAMGLFGAIREGGGGGGAAGPTTLHDPSGDGAGTHTSEQRSGSGPMDTERTAETEICPGQGTLRRTAGAQSTSLATSGQKAATRRRRGTQGHGTARRRPVRHGGRMQPGAPPVRTGANAGKRDREKKKV